MTNLRRTTALTIRSLAPTGLTFAPAVASGRGDAVQRSGSCSSGTEWKIKAEADNNKIDVEAEIDSNKAGQTWSWKLKQSGGVVATGESQTTAPSGSFSVEPKRTGQAGTDSFVFRAVNPKSGEVCRASVSW